ncbi:hypothetical protein PTSG_06590 [Salpingoeca rosetta]|uniref:Uncharacterized protein n=1 Tax=Salpingoeca rosetta (strain ATCC 50818 / BSB-021) TaxID=946362 RepID=F2UFF1_SALR5|nr:uncharacterized protein PTSG_06590 [Salpingoeca rosetta]EGD75519.1 hypothetical protein PTSG_06590 [Salpingoeca rosetta]|eukprot:XP_004991976.1 hypothetical protein PTSG_06590 [Salpingoeca rosetta]
MSLTASSHRTSIVERTALVDSMHRAESLKRSNQAMRDRIMELRNALRTEQKQSQQAHKEKVAAVHETRQLSEMEQNQRLLQQETKLLKERAQEIKRLKEDLERKRQREVEEIIRQRDEAEAARHRQMQQERLEAENALREEVKKETAAEVESRLGGEISSLQRALLDTEQQLARLERLYDAKCKHDAEKAEQIKDLRQQHLEELNKIRKDNNASLKNEMSEFRQKEREIRDLQTELSALRRNYDRLSAEKSRVEEDMQRYKTADSLSKRTPKKLMPAIGQYDPANHGPDPTVKRARTPSKADAAELRKLKAKAGDQARDIRRLNARVHELEALLEKQRAEAAVAAVSPAKSTAASPGKNVEDLTRKVRNLTNQLRRDKQQLKDLQSENFKLKNKNDAVNQELQKTRQLLQKAESSARALRAKKTQIPTPTKPQPEDKRLERRVAELERMLSERTEQVDSLRRSKSKADTDNKRLASRAEAAENKAKQAETSAAKAMKQLESMKAAAETSAARRAEATDLKAMIRSHEDTIRQLNRELLKAQQQFTQLARANPANSAAIVDLQSKYDALRATVDMDADTATLATRNAELSADVSRLQEQAAAVAPLKQQNEALTAQVADLKATVEQLEEAVEEAQQGASQQETVTALEAKVAALEDEVAALNGDLAAAETKASEDRQQAQDTLAQTEARLRDEIASLEEQLQSAESERAAAHTRADDAQQEADTLRSQLEDMQAALNKAEADKAEAVAAAGAVSPTVEEAPVSPTHRDETAAAAVAAARARRGSKLKQDKAQLEARKREEEEKRKREEEEEAELLRKEKEEQDRLQREREEEEEQQRKREEEEAKAEAERLQREKEEEEERLEREKEEAERIQKEKDEQERLAREREEQEQRKREEEEEQRKRDEEEEVVEPLQLPPASQRPNMFWRALYDYDPLVSSPNDFGADEELTLIAGTIIGTFGEMDEDGFYIGENEDGQRGLVPSNFLGELTPEEEEEARALMGEEAAATGSAAVNEAMQTGEEKEGEGEAKADALLPPDELALSDLRPDCAVVTWKLPLNLNPVDHYVVQMNDQHVAEIVDPTCTIAQIEEAYQPGETYTVQVVSVGYEGEKSEPSRPLTFICPTPEAQADAGVSLAEAAAEGQQPVRLFVALYDYDPETMSPNDAFEDELELKEGMVIKVLGDVGEDGFFLAEHNGRQGLVPSNFVEELNPETVSEFTDTADFVSQADSADVQEAEDEPETALQADVGVGTLVRALYDYLPEELSPNDDIAEELSFHMHDLMRVVEPRDDDGFFKCEHIQSARQGYVPGNFIAPVPEEELEAANNTTAASSAAQGNSAAHAGSTASSTTSSTKKKGFFKVFSKR